MKIILGIIAAFSLASIGFAWALISGDSIVLNEGLNMSDELEVVKNA